MQPLSSTSSHTELEKDQHIIHHWIQAGYFAEWLSAAKAIQYTPLIQIKDQPLIMVKKQTKKTRA